MSKPAKDGYLAGRVGLFRLRDFRLLWFGETTSVLGTTISELALPLIAVVTLHASTFQVGVLTGVTWLPWLVVGLPAGAWVDRFHRRPLMLICDAISFILLLSVPLAAHLGVLTLTQLLVVAFLAGVVSVFFATAYQVYLPDIVATDDLTEANAKLQGSASAAEVAGPGLAGLLTQLAGAVTGLVADAFSFAVSAFCLLRINSPDIPPATIERHSTLFAEIAGGLRFLANDPFLRVQAVFGGLSNLTLTGYQSILVVFLVRQVGISPGTVGLVLAGMSTGGIAGAASARAIGRRLGTARGQRISVMCATPFGLLIPLAEPGIKLGLVVVGGFAIGLGFVCGNILKDGFRQSYCPRHILGRVIVSMQFVNYGAIPIGALLGGTLGTALGLRPTLWIMLVGLMLGSLILLIGPGRHQRDFPARPAATA
ncbi:MAG TPA: MFS transporter [Pseudonocardiaceae bacterium]|nr:MFS transporter [Pseudonocardiaceae bacterium]